jgi:hypothetical protein
MKFTKFARQVIRTAFAIYFWLRPLVEICHLRFPASWQSFYARSSPEAFLLLFIAYYSLLADGGWVSVAYDVTYVYFWPLVLIWLAVKFTSVRAYKALKETPYYKGLLLPKVVPPQVPSVPDAKGGVPPAGNSFRLAIGRLARPFTQFFLLWSLLILNTSNLVLTWVALAVISFGAIAIIRSLSLFLSDAGSWITKLKGNFAAQVANNIAVVRAYNESQDDKRSRDAANALLLYETTFRYMSENKDRLARWTVIASILITVPLYLYLSVIFTSIYLGVARLNHIPWPWTDALTTSIFIPFAFTDLPHNLWIRLIGGCQALVVTVLGYTILFRRMQSSIQQLSQVAGELSAPLGDQTLKEILITIKSRPTGSTAAG